MSEKRCDRCGTRVPAGRVVCPTCDNVVDLSFLGEATRAEFDDDGVDDASPFAGPTQALKRPTTSPDDGDDDAEPEMPTLRTAIPQAVAAARTAKAARVEAAQNLDSERTVTFDVDPMKKPAAAPKKAVAKLAVSEFEEPQATANVRSDFLNEETEADLSELGSLLHSSTDALILGDANDVVESLWVEESLTRPELEALPRASANADFLTAATTDGVRDIIPVQVYIGADIAAVIAKDAVLEKVGDHSGVLLTSFEEYVLAQIDGQRPVARIQKRMGLSEGDLRIALALLVDKKLVQRSGRAEAAVGAGPTLPRSVAPVAARAVVEADDDDSYVTAANPAARPQTTELPSIPRPAPRHVASPESPTEKVPGAKPPTVPTARVRVAKERIEEPANVPAAVLPLPGASLATTPASVAAAAAPHPAPPPASPPASPPGSPGARLPTPLAPLPGIGQQMAPSPKTSTQLPPMPMNMDYASAVRSGLIVDDAGRSKAAALHAQCLRDLKNGAVARAYAVACMAHEAAPDVLAYKEVVDDWNNFVSVHRTPEDARLHAQAVSAETAGDAVRAVALLRQAVKANPGNAAVWNRLGLLLATRLKDVDGALNAMTRAIELAPSDPTFMNNFGKIAAMAERRGTDTSAKGGLFQKLFRR